MGKSTLAAQLRGLGVPVFDADAEVRRLLTRDASTIAAIAAIFPAAVREGQVQRTTLACHIFSNTEARRKLEALLHPRVRAAEARFIRFHCRHRRSLVVLDIPLLFETHADARVQAVMVVTAPFWLQRKRALARPGMSDALMRDILAQQMPDRQKRRRADAVIHTGLGKAHSLQQLRRVLRTLNPLPPGEGRVRGAVPQR